MPESNLKTAVLKTLAFFDIFNFPLTSLEVWKYLYGATGSLAEVAKSLSESSAIKEKAGFYFLSQRDEGIVAERKLRYNLAEPKFRRVKRVGWWLAVLPFVRQISVCNTLAYSNAREGSDIDLFVVVEAGKVWTTRFFCLLFLKIFGLRPKAPNTENKFCLSFFIDTKHLDIKDVALPRDDIYLWYWLAQLYPVYDQADYYEKFWEANSWLKQYLPQSLSVIPSPRRSIKLSWFWRLVKRAKEALWSFSFWENFFQRLQLKALPPVLKDKINKDVGVVIKEGIIKLIVNDRREAYRNEWIAKVNSWQRQNSDNI